MSVWIWVAFLLFIFAMLAIDLGLFQRHSHAPSTKEAAGWTVTWVTLALLFNAGLYFWMGRDAALEFLTGYILEYSLSVDNIFVFIVLFSYFKVPVEYRHRVLFWGILGALILRGVLIAMGAALIAEFHWIIYIFGAFLIYTGFKLGFSGDETTDPEHNPVLKWFRRLMPVASEYHGQFFLIREAGRWVATPLLVVLVMVETTDVMFALDSIPAIFGVTQNPFIVFTSNVFAILGLRSLYFLLSGVLGLFRYLKYGLAAVLSFVGFKMVLSFQWHVSTPVSLVVIAGLLGASVIASLLIPAKREAVVETAAGHEVKLTKDGH